MSASELPIYDVSEKIVEGLEACGRVVLSAPTGSGKSTQVPQILLDRLGIDGDIVVLQPRRLAARLLAKRVAKERGQPVGGEVGFQIRFESAISSKTRIRFVTEAILLRQILDDPSLNGVGAVIFDEFHERHLSSDLSIACALQSVEENRPDLKLVVMSATLDIDRLESYMGSCVRVEASGRAYPVDVRYGGAALGRHAAPVWERAAKAFREECRAGQRGDFLIFMPGAYEIRKTIEAVEALPEASGYQVLPLHGELPPEAQDRAVSASGDPKVIVSTNVAETSITIEGVRTVIDGGLAKIARFDPIRGVNAILVEPISQAAAEQRKGRAGRTGPGRCIRLWSEAEHLARPAHDTAEVRRVDLSETLLMLAVAGVRDFGSFPWFEVPDQAAIDRALSLLKDLGALAYDNSVSEVGRAMAHFPLHPRYSRMLIEAERLGVLEEAALIAAVSQGRPFYRASRDSRIRRAQEAQIEDHASHRSDFFIQLKAFEFAQSVRFQAEPCRSLGIHGVAARQAGEVARQILQIAERRGLTGSRESKEVERAICRCVLSAFSDQLCLRNDTGTRRCKMVHRRSGELRRESVVDSPLFVASEMEERELRGQVTVLLSLATAVDGDDLEACFPSDFSSGSSTRYDASLRRVVSGEIRSFRDLILSSQEGGEPNFDEAASLLAKEVLSGNLKLKNWDSSVDMWIRRVNFLAKHCPETEVSPIDDEALGLLLEQVVYGATSYKEIKDRPVMPVFKKWILAEQQYYLDAYAPAEIELPRRKRPVKIRYEEDGRAFIASKLQDFYDVSGDSLRIANRKVPLLVELLAPNGRPAHLTEDLDGFWGGAYHHVRKELAGRYPKHDWR